jgi:eukaryotic-like serine/threonine-protein kinase
MDERSSAFSENFLKVDTSVEQQIPASIDKYEIVRVLGRGTTSTVYFAYDAFTERQVAIKVFNSSLLTDPEYGHTYRKLIANEASLVGRLNHPHIVSIYDAAINRDKCYIVMEYIQGETLEKFGQPDSLLPIETVVEIIFKSALALAHAHMNGIIHRDIKPANIMLCRNGDIKITDFGAAVLTRSDRTEMVGIGSPAYMSPEQVLLHSLTPQTDIYSLGVVMYRLLTGRMPFNAESTYSLSQKILSEQPACIRTLRPELSPSLAGINAKAMYKDLKQRYHSMEDFAKALAEIAKLELPRENVSNTEKYNTMRNLSFFRDFDDIELWEVMRISVWGRIPAGTCLVQEGDEGDFFFIVADGEVKIIKGGKTLGIQHAGQCYGEMCYIRGGKTTRTASVVANTPVTLLKIKPGSLKRASESCQISFSHAFMNILVDRLTKADIELASMSCRSTALL